MNRQWNVYSPPLSHSTSWSPDAVLREGVMQCFMKRWWSTSSEGQQARRQDGMNCPWKKTEEKLFWHIDHFVVDDNLDEIIKSSHTNGYTFIYKSKGFNTAQMNNYKGVLTRVNNEKKNFRRNLTTYKMNMPRSFAKRSSSNRQTTDSGLSVNMNFTESK